VPKLGSVRIQQIFAHVNIEELLILNLIIIIF